MVILRILGQHAHHHAGVLESPEFDAVVECYLSSEQTHVFVIKIHSKFTGLKQSKLNDASYGIFKNDLLQADPLDPKPWTGPQ